MQIKKTLKHCNLAQYKIETNIPTQLNILEHLYVYGMGK